jgi:HlyD family secretion protein
MTIRPRVTLFWAAVCILIIGVPTASARQLTADVPVHEVRPGKLRVSVVERGSLEAARTADVLCQVENQTTILSIRPEGTSVARGELVCQLDSASLRDQLVNQTIATRRAEAAYHNAKLAREAAEIAVAEYANGIFQQESYALKSQVVGARAAIQKAEDRLERTKRAHKRVSEAAKAVAVKTPADIVAELDIEDRLEAAGAAVQREKETLELARSKLELLEKYTLPKTTKALKVEVERKRSDELARQSAWELEKSREEKLNKQIESCRITAPGAGVIVYANNPNRPVRGQPRPQIEEGATVRPRQKILSIVDLSGPMQVNTKVHESIVDRINRGLKALVKVDALPATPLPGLVVRVAPLPDPGAMATWDPKVYTTIVRRMDNQQGLRPGLTAKVEILINDLDNVLTVPIQAVLHLDGNDVVLIKKPEGPFERREVILGERSDKLIEVKNGLASGDLVTLNPFALLSESEKRQLPSSPAHPAAR